MQPAFEEVKPQMEALHEETRQRLAAVLTEDQLQKYDELSSKRKTTHGTHARTPGQQVTAGLRRSTRFTYDPVTDFRHALRMPQAGGVPFISLIICVLRFLVYKRCTSGRDAIFPSSINTFRPERV